MARPALLDVNVLVALFDPTHVHHDPAHDWFADNRSRGWATCPLTENAFVRILSRPLPGRPAERPAILAGHLRALCGAADHLFWPDTISLLDTSVLDLSAVPQRQLTDLYLATLAHAHGGVLATFDASIFVAAAAGADLEVMGAVEL